MGNERKNFLAGRKKVERHIMETEGKMEFAEKARHHYHKM